MSSQISYAYVLHTASVEGIVAPKTDYVPRPMATCIERFRKKLILHMDKTRSIE
jgi:hypothetical protein